MARLASQPRPPIELNSRSERHRGRPDQPRLHLIPAVPSMMSGQPVEIVEEQFQRGNDDQKMAAWLQRPGQVRHRPCVVFDMLHDIKAYDGFDLSLAGKLDQLGARDIYNESRVSGKRWRASSTEAGSMSTPIYSP